MQNIYIGNTNLYYLLFYFVLFSFLGWLMETVRVSIKNKKYINRGFANGPYCPIYGFGMCFVVIFLSDLKDNIPLLFVSGVILTTTLEYVTAYLLEVIFKAKWWDYSYKKFNLKGRICLDISIAWGILSVIMIEWVIPLIDDFISIIPLFAGEIFLLAVIALIAVDVVITAKGMLSFKNVLYKLAILKAETKEELNNFIDKFSENLREYIDMEELTEKLSEVSAKKSDFKQMLAEKKKLIKDIDFEEIKARFADREISEEKLEAINKIRQKYARFVAISKMNISKNHRRIFNAYPDFKLKNEEFQEIFKNIKDNFKRKR